MVTIHSVPQGSDSWHALRAGKYTGSNAWKLLRYGAIDYALTEQSSFNGNFYTKRGHILEDEAIELYEAITGRHVERPGFVTNDEFPSCGYSPDGLDLTPTLEVKAFNIEKHLRIINGDIPFEVLAQVHFGLLICDRSCANLLPYNPDVENPKEAFKIITIKRNRNIINNFKRILRKEPAHAIHP
jgi:YqaJ-like viral recombinase domain